MSCFGILGRTRRRKGYYADRCRAQACLPWPGLAWALHTLMMAATITAVQTWAFAAQGWAHCTLAAAALCHRLPGGH